MIKLQKRLKTIERPTREESLCYEIGRLSQGWKESDGLSTMLLIKRAKMLKHKIITCGRIACDIRLAKKDSCKRCRIRLTIGGSSIECEGETSTVNAERTTIKIL